MDLTTCNCRPSRVLRKIVQHVHICPTPRLHQPITNRRRETNKAVGAMKMCAPAKSPCVSVKKNNTGNHLDAPRVGSPVSELCANGRLTELETTLARGMMSVGSGCPLPIVSPPRRPLWLLCERLHNSNVRLDCLILPPTPSESHSPSCPSIQGAAVPADRYHEAEQDQNPHFFTRQRLVYRTICTVAAKMDALVYQGPCL
jgi:hypothetical protein